MEILLLAGLGKTVANSFSSLMPVVIENIKFSSFCTVALFTKPLKGSTSMLLIVLALATINRSPLTVGLILTMVSPPW